MPMPTPSGKEKEDAFVNRCMGNATMKSEYSDDKQRLAVCYSSWRKSKGIKEKKARKKSPESLRKIVEYANRAMGKLPRPFVFGSMVVSEAFKSLRTALDGATKVRFGKDAYVQDFSNKELIVGFYRDRGVEVGPDGQEKYQKIGYKVSKGEVVFTTAAEVVQLTRRMKVLNCRLKILLN